VFSFEALDWLKMSTAVGDVYYINATSYLMTYKRKSFSFDSNMATTVVDMNINGKTTVAVRLAIGKDMFAIAILACELAYYKKLAHRCEETYAKLMESIFWKQPTFQGPIVLMLEVATPQSEDEEQQQ
jgi:hypothetical protein